MKRFELSVFFIVFFLVKEYCAWYWNIGRLPGGSYKPKNCSVPMQESVPQFLASCVTFPKHGNCAKNFSTPYVYWLTCNDNRGDSFKVAPTENCENLDPDDCNDTGITTTDPGWHVYSPLQHPEEPIRVYPEIFEKIRHINKSYAYSYVVVLKKTFDGWFGTQYNYKWKEYAPDQN